MRTALALLTGLIVIVQPFTANALELKAESAITAATVFQDRATITRTATIDIPAGAHTVLFENMPIALFPDSLRVEGAGTAAVTLGALSHKAINDADLVNPREKEINDQIRALQDKILVIAAESRALQKKSKFYDQLLSNAGERTREELADFNLKPEQWDSAAGTIGTAIEEIEKSLVTKQLQQRSINEQLVKLQQDLGQLRTGNRQTYQIALPVEAPGSTKLTLSLSYQMPNATWRPVYDARLDTKTGALEIIQYGAVTQRTGEDWSDIALSLSTARPQRGTSLPPLQPMWVDISKAYAQKTSGARADFGAVAQNMVMSASPMETEMADAVSDKDPLESWRRSQEERQRQTIQTAKIDSGGFTTEYRIPGPSDVLADGTESKLLIGTFEADNELQIHVKPQLSTEAYLVAHATLKGESPILPGQVNLFRDGAYVGQNSLPLLRPGKEYDLFYGIDDQIEVRRETLKEESGDSGILGRDRVKEQRYITTIHNLRQTPVKLALTESIPVARHEDIKVELLKDSTTPGYTEDIHNKKGVLQWVKDLQASQKTDIKLGWKVTWPKDQNISGL
ncbi:MAG: mucoidy inhibitor MuiA family protein [Rhodospirillales bacterium]|nr:mucoidy inhibitor MuiA family protein [Rhodospirillales bacterium]MCB9997023.1 mucoidy inhibitor MuiA family protein [Rhodospirillales bacterium]